MAALPPTAGNGRPVSPPPQLHQWSGRQSPPPPAAQSGFVRMGGGRATDSAPYQSLHSQNGAPGITRPLSSHSINERLIANATVPDVAASAAPRTSSLADRSGRVVL